MSPKFTEPSCDGEDPGDDCHHQRRAKNIVSECNSRRGGKKWKLICCCCQPSEKRHTQGVKLHCKFFFCLTPIGCCCCCLWLMCRYGAKLWETGKNISLRITIKHDICLLLVGYLYNKLFILISVLVLIPNGRRKNGERGWGEEVWRTLL